MENKTELKESEYQYYITLLLCANVVYLRLMWNYCIYQCICHLRLYVKCCVYSLLCWPQVAVSVGFCYYAVLFLTETYETFTIARSEKGYCVIMENSYNNLFSHLTGMTWLLLAVCQLWPPPDSKCHQHNFNLCHQCVCQRDREATARHPDEKLKYRWRAVTWI